MKYSLLMLLGLAFSLHASPQYGISKYGELKYPANFSHFDYANPQAPKGGELRQEAIGTFDNFNPFILKGNSAEGLGLLFDTLMQSSADEPFSKYGLLAESIEILDNGASVRFVLRPEAKFSDGSQVTAEDVVESFKLLTEKGHLHYRLYYADVVKVWAENPQQVRFQLRDGQNSELPLILGELPVMSKAYWAKADFSKTTLQAPVGSGPYQIAQFEVGRYIRYQRREDYWAKDLPVNRGRFNFDSIKYEYFRDQQVALEAFKAGQYDYREERKASDWAQAYDFPAVKNGQIKKEELAHKKPTGMQAFVFNMRKPLFADIRVRQALNLAFDFEWLNRSFFFGAYSRSLSFFSNSDMASQGLPSADELKLLEPFKAELPAELFSQAFSLPVSDGSGNIRNQLRQASSLLDAAGWHIQGAKRVNAQGQAFKFEILLLQPAFERVALAYAANLKKLGIEVSVRTVDMTQYKQRTDQFDFDMIVDGWGQSLSPGNEQRQYWGSQAANTPGSQNTAGFNSKVIDSLIESLIRADSRAALIAASRALDRVLLFQYALIPNWHIRSDRVVYWDKFERPALLPDTGVDPLWWWAKPAKAAKP